MNNEKNLDSDVRLGWGERLGFGIGAAGPMLINSVIGTYLLVYMTNVAFLDVAIISAIIAVSKVFDGISDLLIGNVIDHTVSRMGKARIWLVRMCLPLSFSFMLLFWVPTEFPMALKYVYVFIMYNVTNAFFLTFVQISHYSLVSLISSDREEQGLLGVLDSIMRSVCSLLVGVIFVKILIASSDVPGEQNTQRGYTAACMVFAAVSLAVTLISVAATRERVTGDTESSKTGGRSFKELLPSFKIILSDRNWRVMLFTQILIYTCIALQISSTAYFTMYILNDMSAISWLLATTAIPSLIIQLTCPLIMKKIGKKNLFITGAVMQCSGYLGFAFLCPSVPGMVVFNCIKSFGIGMVASTIMGITADIVKSTTQRTGRFMPGAGFAGVSAADKLGNGLGGLIIGGLLSVAGFDAALKTQPASVTSMISFGYLWLPLILTLITTVLIYLFLNIEVNKVSEAEQ